MKNFAKYICLFLAIIGINVNTWAAASTGEVVIFPNGTITVNKGDWNLAGAPTSYNDGSSFTLELNDKYYPVTLHNACDNGILYPANPLGLQVQKNGGYFEMVIQSTVGVTVEIEYSSTSDMTMSLTGVKDAVTCTAGDAQKQTINTNTTEATLRIAAGSNAGYIHYVKLTAKGAEGTIAATGSADGRPGIHPEEKTISENVLVGDLDEINVTVNYADISDLSGGSESYYLDLRIKDEDDEDKAIAEVVAGFYEVTSNSATLNITYQANKVGTYTSTLHLYGYKTGSYSEMYTFDIPLTLTVTGAEHTITLGTPEHGTVATSPVGTAQYTQVVAVTATPDVAGTPKYELDHWDVYKTGESSTKVTVTDGEFVMPDYDVTVSAVFRQQIIWGNYQTYCPVYLYFDDNDDAEATGMPATQKGKKGFTATEPVSAPTLVGRTFEAWYESDTYEGEPFDFATTITADKTLYAKWTVNTHSLMLVKGNDGCTVVTENIPYGTEVEITASDDCFPEHYTFGSWTVNAGGVTLSSTTDNPATFTMLDENVTITANYVQNEFPVTYHAGEDHVEYVETGHQPTGFMPDACAADRVFVGWSDREVTMQDGLPTSIVDPTEATITEPKEFWAVYASKNGGKVTGSETAMHEGRFEPKAGVTIEGNTFNGYESWTLTNTDLGEIVTSVASFYMKYSQEGEAIVQTKNKITDLSKITFYGKVGSGTAVTGYVEYSENGTNWNAISVSRHGATASENVSFTSYNDYEAVLPVVTDAYVRFRLPVKGITGNQYVHIGGIVMSQKERSYYLTDYATSCEKAASTTLTYDAQGGTAQTDVTEAGWVTLPDGDACQRGCYTLTGWQSSLDGLTYEPGAKYLFNHDVTMTAQWSVNSSAAVTVTYHTGLEGATTQTVSDVHCGDILTDVQVPTPEACGQNEFAGWAIGEFENAASKDGIAQYAVGTDVLMGDMELHAIWKQGKSVFTKYTETDVVDGTYILVEPNSSKALSATLVPTPVTIDGTTITTDERFIQWTVTKVGEKFSIHGLDGYLTITADKTNALGISNTAVETWNMKESSTNGVYNIGITFDASDRRVCYNSTKDKWLSYKNRTSGNLYKLSGDGPATFTMDGVCPHIYHATGVSEMTSGTGVSVLAQENGLIIVENTSVVPVAQKVSGDDAFVVTVNNTPLGANGDGSLNYAYSVKFTPTAGNQTYTATYKFIGDGETEDAKHIASEEITFTGYSLPDEFAIVVNRNGQYYALPGGIAAAGTPNAVAVTVVDNEVVDLDASNAYHIGTGAVSGETARATLRLMNGATALWASDAGTLNDYNGDLTSKTAAASTTNTQWTLERVYNENTDAFEGYHLSSDANAAKALFYQSTNKHWGYYNNSYYSGDAYNGEIFFLPIAAQFGDLMDIVEWNGSSVVLNMNGYGATAGKWGVKNASDEMLLAGDRATDRTLEVSTAALVADQYLNIKVYGNANNAPAEPVVESNRNYKIPHIMEGAQSISSAASFSATSILYVKSGTTTVNVNLTVAKVVVCPGAELVVASGKTLTTTELVLRGKIWTYEQPKLTMNGSLVVTGQTYYTRIVADKTAYYPFGLPKSSKVEDVRLSNGQPVTYGSTANWNLKSYNADAQLNNEESAWDNVTLTDGKATIAAKTYYIMGSGSAYYREYYFPISLSEGVDNTVAIAANQGGAETLDKNKGWNGFASPYTDVYTNTPAGDPSEFVKVTEKVENNEQWWQHVPSQLYPFFPYFYQTKAAGTLSFGSGLNFEASTPASVAARAAKAEEKEVSTQWVQVMLKNENGQEDETNLYVHPTKFTVGYETSYDVTKMSVAGDRPLVWTKMACGDLAFNALPDSIAETRIAVGVNAGTAKTLSFSLGREDFLSRVEEVNLIDEVMGTTTNLLLSDYEWNPADGTEGRFFLNIVLQKASSTTTGIDGGIEELGNAPRKVIYDSKMFIIVDGKVYDGTGKLVNK